MARPARTVSTRLSRFAAVGAMATALDFGGYLALRELGLAFGVADVLALGIAGVFSYQLHRSVTMRDEPFLRWLGHPWIFAAVGVIAGSVDVALLTSFGGSAPGKLGAIAAAAVVRSIAHRWVLFRVIREDQEHPSNRPSPSAGPRLSVVIPAFREADRIAQTVAELHTALSELRRTGDLEVVVVDDGSGDGTGDVARAAGADLVIDLEQNLGKGGAVRAGMLAATGRCRAFLDADLAYSPDQVLVLLQQIESGWDVVVGNRHHVATRTLVPTSRLRDVGGRMVNLTTQVLLLGQYRDTQCGLKAMRGDVAEQLFATTRVTGFAFDIEVLHLVERYRLSLTEVPVHVRNSDRTTVNLVRDTGRLLRDLRRIRRWARQGAYPAAIDLPDPQETGS